MDPILTIAIPTYNNPQQLSWCIQSLIMHTEYPFHIIIINNDGTVDGENSINEFVSAMNVKDMVSVIHTGANLGWMGALNVALERTKTPFFCSLNDDVVFLPAYKMFWRKIMSHFSDPGVGAVGPCSNFVMGAQNLFSLNVQNIVKTSLLIGFCKIIRTDLIKNSGGYDETLPGGDDLDTSIRISDAGYELICDRTVYLHHIGQQTGRRLYPNQWDTRESQENINNALIRKHGVKKWYDCFVGSWTPYVSPSQDNGVGNEDSWYLNHISKYDPGVGLNVGCGDKPISGPINIDSSPRGGRSSGGRKFYDSNPDIVADARELPYENSSMEYICAAHILEHLIDPISALKEWKRVLKPGGYLYMTLPNQDILPTILIDYTHVHAYNPDAIKNIVEVVGFSVENIEVLSGGNIGIVAQKPEAIHIEINNNLDMWTTYIPIGKSISEKGVLLNDGN